MVKCMIDVFGDLPLEWESKWEQMKSDAAARGDIGCRDRKQVPDYRLEKQFNKMVHDPASNGLLPVIQGLTKLLPSDRSSASQALQLIKDNCGEH